VTDVPVPRAVTAAEARAELSRLDARVATMRAVLTQLLQDLVRAEAQLEHGRAAQLLEANERLVVIAMGALTHAGAANGARDEALHPRSSDHESEIAEHERRHAQLLEANEQLVLAALGAQELVAAAEETRRRQASLLKLVANELRNPFAPIRLAAATLGRPDADKTLLPRVQVMIEEQMDKALRLVNEVLDPRQANGGRWGLERSVFDAAELIGAAVRACQPTMEKRQQTLKMTVLRPLNMDGDSESLTQTLMSLLTGASVHTHNGGWIDVNAEAVSGKLLLSVIDSGHSVSHRATETIPDPFALDPRDSVGNGEQLDSRLKAVREIVEAHGGTVDAAVGGGGHGSHFTVSLPMGASSIDSDVP